MDIVQIIIGRYLLALFGACFRYLYINISSLVGINQYTTFKKIWNPSNKRDDNSMTNHGVGLIIFIVFMAFLIIVMT